MPIGWRIISRNTEHNQHSDAASGQMVATQRDKCDKWDERRRVIIFGEVGEGW